MGAPDSLRWHAARLRSMGRDELADRLDPPGPFPYGRSRGTLADAMDSAFDPVFRRTLAHREDGRTVNAGMVISCRREIRSNTGE